MNSPIKIATSKHTIHVTYFDGSLACEKKNMLNGSTLTS